jgi:hypothetical protein
MCPTCGRLFKDCLCLGLGVCVLCHALKEPMDKHNHHEAPKAETTRTTYATMMTTTTMTTMTTTT